MKTRLVIILLLLSSLVISCGKGNNDSNSGSLGFSLTFVKPTSSQAKAIISRVLTNDPCIDYGITTVQGKVYNSSNTVISTGGPWQCSDHQGKFTSVPAGTGYTAVFEGLVNGTVTWRGQATNISIYEAQQTTITDPISMLYTGAIPHCRQLRAYLLQTIPRTCLSQQLLQRPLARTCQHQRSTRLPLHFCRERHPLPALFLMIAQQKQRCLHLLQI